MIEFYANNSGIKINDVKDLRYIIKEGLVDQVIDILYGLAEMAESSQEEECGPFGFDLGDEDA